MTRTPPTIEDLTRVAQEMVRLAQGELQETGSTMAKVILGDGLSENAGAEVILIDPRVMSPSKKPEVARMVRQRIALHGFMHAVVLLDAWSVKFKDQHEKDLFERIMAHIRGVSIKDLHEVSGLGTLESFLIASVQTMEHTLYFTSKYSGTEPGSFKFGELTAISEDKFNDVAGEGSMFKFFNLELEGVDWCR